MRKTNLLLALPALWLSTATWAGPMVCPDLSNAVQVNTCPSDEELKFTFNGYCNDNARMYDKPAEQLCEDFALYRALKNTSLWETGDGRFSGYVSCEPGTPPLAKAKPVAIKLDQQGSVTRFTCRYDTGVNFTHRTKAKCSLDTADAAKCATDTTACKVTCDGN